ncbi:MAG: Fur family transcriptional regulator [Candidatus Cloacimonadota bacterium]|nr:Fur family transcriptional regulator [Candidatus Cloacimonadota bacterium]
MERVKRKFDEVGIRPTSERMSIFRYLIDNRNHPTANMIYNSVLKKIPTISKATVYNSLNLFTEKGVINPVMITGNETRYDSNTSPHHHFLCEKCGKIIDIDIQCPYFKKGMIKGNKINELHGYFIGICKDCLEKQKDTE